MNRNFNVIKINGFKGLLFALFLICCFATGVVVFPGWICMHAWNFVAGYFLDMPTMTIVHGSILWLIIALSIYAINKGNFSISFGTAAPMPMSMTNNEERIKEIIKKINERNASLLPVTKHQNSDEEVDENHENSDKIVK